MNNVFTLICMHLNILILIKRQKTYSTSSFFACYKAPNLTESSLKTACSLLSGQFFTRKMNISK